jgi:hypothetical protein
MKMECINTIATFRALAVPAALRPRFLSGVSFAHTARVVGATGGGSGVPIPGEARVRKRRAKM